MRRSWSVVVGFALLSIAMAVSLTGGLASDATPAAGKPCPVTEPNGNTPPDRDEPVPGSYGNDVLWTNVWMWGEDGVVLPAYDDRVQDACSIVGLKWAWWRYVPGELSIEGRRLDGPASPLIGEVPEGYRATGFQVSGITFPTQGCWAVTGRRGSG